jgi:glutamine synthetase
MFMFSYAWLRGIPMAVYAEYIWMDGHKPTQKLRSKTRVLMVDEVTAIDQLPDWNYDGSSTNQAPGDSSDCHLKPMSMFADPIRGAPHILVVAEVFLADGVTPHPTNTRAQLREVVDQVGDIEPWFGIEQEYTLMEGRTPLGWPENGFPAPQGPYYCGVGADEVYGREIVEAHMEACTKAGLGITGINAEVMPGQWEFQVMGKGALEATDMTWIARYLLYRIGEDFGVSATIHPKPVKGDWNGAGMHTNFSTAAMRQPGGMKIIEAACEALGTRHATHIAHYGAFNNQRLTGLHETQSIDQFSYGVSDRGASIRIPLATAQAGFGYLEDRRPSANADPYVVARLLLETCCLGVTGNDDAVTPTVTLTA